MSGGHYFKPTVGSAIPWTGKPELCKRRKTRAEQSKQAREHSCIRSPLLSTVEVTAQLFPVPAVFPTEMDSNLELHMNINPALLHVAFVKVSYHCNRNETRTVPS